MSVALSALMLLCLAGTTRSLRHFNVKTIKRSAFLHNKPSLFGAPTSAIRAASSQIDEMNNILTDVFLTIEEDELFTTLRKVVEEESLGTTVRVAGGWVRDKLLGVSGKEDIDIALDNMAGNDFAIALNKWNINKGLKSFKIGVIQSNPEKSKHLETATVQLGKFSVDFVNLRTETYAENSRIPEMSFGTPEQDAMRRDLTINSLFYNIHTKSVEDYSGRGVQDLKTGIISTPLPALITLQDDPLRLLRAVRFACRFFFDITPELLTASTDATVRVALGTKVSKERVFQEVEQMLRSVNHARAVCLLHYIQLVPLILPLPAIQELCLSSFIDQGINTVSSNATASVVIKETSTAEDDASGKKKKKKNNEVEVQVPLTREEHSFVQQTMEDFHPYGCSASLIHTLLQKSSAEKTHTHEADVSGDAAGCRNVLSRTIRENNPYLLHFLRDLSSSQSDESGKVLRFASMTSLAYFISQRSLKKKKFNNPLTENILLVDLKMRSKDVEAAIIIQGSSLVFADLMRKIMRGEHTSPATAAADTASGPKHGVLRRLEVGLAIRKAGPLYPQAIQLAVSHLILQALVAEQKEGGKGQVEGSEKGVERSVYYAVFDALVTACDVAKLGGSMSNYKKHTNTDSPSSTSPHADSHTDPTTAILHRLSGDDVTGIISACNQLLETLTVLDLTESYKITPLVAGDSMKNILKNIPRGTMFGEVMQCQLVWMLCNPSGTLEELTEYILKTYPSWQ